MRISADSTKQAANVHCLQWRCHQPFSLSVPRRLASASLSVGVPSMRAASSIGPGGLEIRDSHHTNHQQNHLLPAQPLHQPSCRMASVSAELMLQWRTLRHSRRQRPAAGAARQAAAAAHAHAAPPACAPQKTPYHVGPCLSVQKLRQTSSHACSTHNPCMQGCMVCECTCYHFYTGASLTRLRVAEATCHAWMCCGL